MERGPLALFGAIIAVGLGPAMWLGAQFGNAADQPGRPPAVTVQQEKGVGSVGGEGGAAPEDPVGVLRSDPKSNVQPLITATPKPHRSSAHPSASASPSPSPSESSPATSPSPSHEHSTPPTEPSSPDDDPPSQGSGDDGGGSPAPPSPPGGSDDVQVSDLSPEV
jgi:hypothetical protein